ncbi:MAG: hypothetical protein IPN34_12400 [Planctomycetes bacterium]|nr:hypothetical protein [Planctomycetota bacterium]
MRHLALAILPALALAPSVRAQEADPLRLDEKRFATLHAQLCAASPETWESVPWRIDLLAAQGEAAAAKKLLFVWAMDGHPLACT